MDEVVLLALPTSLFSDKALPLMQGPAEIWCCQAAPATVASSSLCHHCGPHPDSFLVKLVSNHPSPVVYDLLVKLSVTQDTNRLRVSDNMVIW